MLSTASPELEYFKEHQKELVGKYKGKVLVLAGQSVKGVFDTKLDAYLDAKQRFKPGSFLIQECAPGPEAYTVTISSLGVFDNADN